MKTFQQFNEDLSKLKRDLDTLERQEGPKQKLAARRRAAKERSRVLAANFKRKSIEKMQAQRERLAKEE